MACVCVVVGHFFFSSRRRHTRLVSDWSSDVCSSDLDPAAGTGTCSGMGDAVAVGGHQHSAVSVFAEFDRGSDGDLRTEIVSLEGYERRSAEIGRASCRERVLISWVGGLVKKYVPCRV